MKKKVLIIDDEESLREGVGYQFSARGFEVMTAVDGVDALEKLESFKPDLITLDMNMPRMNGLEFYERIKGDRPKPPYPVLVLTARANMEDLFRQLDVDGFVVKPFEIDELVKQGEEIIKRESRKIVLDGEGHSPRICVVESDEGLLKEMSLTFLEAGCQVSMAKTGAAAVQKIQSDRPDVVLIQLKLEDISGDIVILKLIQMACFNEVKYILYTSEGSIDANVASKMNQKTGVTKIINSNKPVELLEHVDSILQKKSTE